LLEDKALKDWPAMLDKCKTTNAEIRQTLKESKKQRKRPTPLQGINNLHFQKLTKKALEIFGSAEKAKEWFVRPNRSLRGRTPCDVLTTQAGAKRVETVLGHLEYGVHR
jgi:putative toxin-antitoxin system antitoxin component (TIGR02293 family)